MGRASSRSLSSSIVRKNRRRRTRDVVGGRNTPIPSRRVLAVAVVGKGG